MTQMRGYVSDAHCLRCDSNSKQVVSGRRNRKAPMRSIGVPFKGSQATTQAVAMHT